MDPIVLAGSTRESFTFYSRCILEMSIYTLCYNIFYNIHCGTPQPEQHPRQRRVSAHDGPGCRRSQAPTIIPAAIARAVAIVRSHPKP